MWMDGNALSITNMKHQCYTALVTVSCYCKINFLDWNTSKQNSVKSIQLQYNYSHADVPKAMLSESQKTSRFKQPFNEMRVHLGCKRYDVSVLRSFPEASAVADRYGGCQGTCQKRMRRLEFHTFLQFQSFYWSPRWWLSSTLSSDWRMYTLVPLAFLARLALLCSAQ